MRYYDYSLTFLVPFLESLKTVSGSYQGLNASPGLAETGYFPIYMRGTSGETFNFFDAASGGAGLAEAFALGAIFDKPVFRWDGLSSDSSRSLLWYDPAAAVQTPAQAGLDPDRIFPTPAVVTMRGSWDDANATYVGFKAGSNLRPPGPNPGTGHGDLDQGTFVLDADGQRWAEDLGDDWYSLPGYFSGAPRPPQPDYRWKYYRKRAEGQNTFVFDTSAARDQRESSNPISNSRFKQTSAWALADLTSTASGLVSWRRGVKLFDHRRQVVIRDEVTANANLDAWWFMHTRASISILEDGRSALLTLHGKQMLVRISGMPGATFFDMPALPLPLSPEPSCTATSCQLSGLYSNADFRKLAIHFVETRSVQLAVEFTPLEEGDTLSSLNARDHVLASTLTDWEHGSNEEARDTESRSIKVPDAAPSALDSVHLALHLDSQQRPTSVSCASVDANGRVYGANAVDYRYTSSDPTIVAVSNAGALTFMAKGRARIVVYATDEVTRQRVWNTLTVVSPL